MKNHFFLDSHSFLCNKQSCSVIGYSQREFCELNKSSELFFIKNDFYILTYHDCICVDKYEFLQNIIEKVSDKVSLKEKYKIERSFRVDEDFKENRLRGVQFKTHLDDINYTYSDASGRCYGIVTKRDYLDYVFDKEKMSENKKKCLNYLENSNLRDKDYLINNLENLYLSNTIVQPTEIEVYKTIESLITNIRRKL